MGNISTGISKLTKSKGSNICGRSTSVCQKQLKGRMNQMMISRGKKKNKNKKESQRKGSSYKV